MNRFLLGVNYWPGNSAMGKWTRFDRAVIASDFARIAGLGLDLVRIFLRWDVFQPAPDSIEPAAVAKLEDVVALAESVGLRTMPTFFCGHMSGVNWLPAWTLDTTTGTQRFRTITERGESPHGIGDFYADPGLLAAQRLQVRVVGAALAERTGVAAWDLGNEFSNLREPRCAQDAANWSASLVHELANVAPQPVTGGIHGEDLTFDRNLRASSLCAPWGFATMHGYPVYSAFARNPGDAEVVPFLSELVAGFARKPVLFTEFGNPACPPEGTNGRCLDEAPMASYATEVLERLHAGGALGALWWCWSDYELALATEPPFDRAPHELRFGLVRADGSLKPAAYALAAFARERRIVRPATLRELENEDEYYAALPHSTNAAFERYVHAREPVSRSSAHPKQTP